MALPGKSHLDSDTLAALVEASAVISSSLNFQKTLQAIAETAADVLDGEASSVILLDRVRNKLVFRAASGESGQALVGEEFDANRSIAGRVVSTGEGQLVREAREHPDFFAGIDRKTTFFTRGMVVAPMRLGEETVGVLEVLNKRGGEMFTERDLEILQVFANLAAISIANAQSHERVKRENRQLRQASQRHEAIIGKSAVLQEVLRLCDRVAGANATVLLLGETGTGKEVTARYIHARSERRERPFVAINCAALPETLLESELFGHEAGAFTGAAGQKMGRFELADRGTLFLDEIGDISHSTQVKLLRVLQEREFVRVGGTKTISCDVRIIAATNRDLKQAMEKGEFREDLFYRLNVFPIHLPPLRARREDIPDLVRHFVEHSAHEIGTHPPGISDAALELLCAYPWPGNIREMRNLIERAVLMCDCGEIQPQHLPPEIRAGVRAGRGPSDGESPQSALEQNERDLIVQALEAHAWNQTRAAKALNISRDNLRYRLKKYDIRKPG